MPRKDEAPSAPPGDLVKIIKLQPAQSHSGDVLEVLLDRLQAHIDAYRAGDVGPDSTAWEIIFACSDLTA